MEVISWSTALAPGLRVRSPANLFMLSSHDASRLTMVAGITLFPRAESFSAVLFNGWSQCDRERRARLVHGKALASNSSDVGDEACLQVKL